MYENLLALPGPQLRRLRIDKVLSLKVLAAEVGTSPSALHRYESGWGRFELGTLRRLAAALGARLVVSIEPVRSPAPAAADTPVRLAQVLRPLFWDVDLTAHHLRENPLWVLRRVLEFGDWKTVHRARGFFGDEAVRRAAAHRAMDARTRRFWQVVLGSGEAAS